MIGTRTTASAKPIHTALQRRHLTWWQPLSLASLALSVIVALASYRYLLGIPPVPDDIALNTFATPWLVLHAGSASTALLLGAVQSFPIPRGRSPSVHRITGRLYVLSCLAGALSGFVLALGTNAGLVASFGFGLLATAWAVVNVLGWQRAWVGQYASHRRWMIRSWALTLSAVTLRLYLPIAEIADLPSPAAYQAISFLCWVPNLIIAELFLRARGGFSRTTVPHRPFAP